MSVKDKPLLVRFPSAQKALLRQAAAKDPKGRSQAQIVRDAVAEWMERQEWMPKRRSR
jgi:hypothetical protein